MKKKLSSFCVILAALAATFADAQLGHSQVPGLGDQVQEPGTFRRVASDINIGMPGRLWVETQIADQGLGYQGSYLTLGGKTRLFEDRFDGRWLGEARVHHSLEDGGGFFANVGVERVFSIKAAEADLVMGMFYDFDGDEQGSFAHSFSQVGVNAAIKTKRWDLIGNGYFPVGITDYETNCFLGNSLLSGHGLDSALQGFDATLRMRPKQLAFGNGWVDIGGYGYSSDTVKFFGGGRLRLGFQTKRGLVVSGELNHDDRFSTSGGVNLGFVFGAQGARGGNYGGIGRDFEETVRNDHIVRFNQDVVLAIDPDTGAAYNVIHVDNTSDPAFGDGTVETPFASLAAAEANSGVGDIIFVNAGSGDRGLNTGITLQNNQRLLSAGASHFLPIQGGVSLELCNEPNGVSPELSNPGGTSVVTLADNNFVSGVTIDAGGATAGIFGNAVDTGRIENTTVTGSDQYGVLLNQISGDWEFSNDNFSNNTIDGLFVRGSTDVNANYTFENNIANNNGFDGIHIADYRAASVSFLANTTDGNARHGLELERYIGKGLDLDIFNHNARNNGATGILINGGDGNLTVLNPVVTGNGQDGLSVLNWSNMLAGDSTFIGTSDGGTADFTGNGIGGGANISVRLTDANMNQDVLITGIASTGAARGLFAESSGIGTVLNIDVIDNVEFSDSTTDGMRFVVNNSGEMNVLIENTDTPLDMLDNAQIAGAGISFIGGGISGQPLSKINAVVRNVNINNDLEQADSPTTVINPFNAVGVDVDFIDNSRINLVVEDSRIESPRAVDIEIDNNGHREVNNVFLQNLEIRGDSGVSVISGDGTFMDFLLTGSDLQSNGILRAADPNDPEAGGDPLTDGQGDFAFFGSADGNAAGGEDNLTRFRLTNNLIRDWTFDAITIQSTGDAQLLAYVTSNEILRNGAGGNNDTDNDNIPGPFQTAPADIDNLDYNHGLVLNASGTSVLTARVNGNAFVNNFELGMFLRTAGQGTINASINSNSFANDIGEDLDNVFDGTTGFGGVDYLGDPLFGPLGAAITDNAIRDFAAQNLGNGNMCLELSSNVFKLLAEFRQQSLGSYNVELDGASNGFSDGDLPGNITTNTSGVCDLLISNEELFFLANGMVDANTPAGGGFQAADHN